MSFKVSYSRKKKIWTTKLAISIALVLFLVNLGHLWKAFQISRLSESQAYGGVVMTENHFSQRIINNDLLPITHRGRELKLYDDFSCEDAYRFRISAGKQESEWKQGIRLNIDGVFVKDGVRYENELIIWPEKHEEAIDIEAWCDDEGYIIYGSRIPENHIRVSHVWDEGDGEMKWGEGGAAMALHPDEHGMVYLCNDGHLDDNFTDIWFGIERFIWVEKLPGEK